MIAMRFASFSIIEEKQERTSEPLFATPVRTWELLLGKAPAGAIPSLLITWLCAGLFLEGITWMGSAHPLKFVSAQIRIKSMVSLFLLVPRFSLLAIMLGVIASSRLGLQLTGSAVFG